MPQPDPHRLAALIVELRRTLRRSAQHPPTGPGGDPQQHTPAEQEILRYIGAHPGSGTSAIAAALHLRANTVSGLCSSLVRDGALVRETHPEDARAARFYLSPTAERRREGKMEDRTSRVAQALGRMAPEQRQLISAAIPALETLVELLGEEGAAHDRRSREQAVTAT